MRKVAHGIAWFDDSVKQRVLDLMKYQCSATRAAYQAWHKHKLRGNEIRVYVKRNYMPLLNQRYISDAVSRTKGLGVGSVLFGGKCLWQRMIDGKIRKEEWQQQRNSQLYSRGDKSLRGNPNIRMSKNRLFIKDPSKKGSWLIGKLSIPKKWCPILDCYEMRVIYREGKFEVKISWEEPDPPKIPIKSGAVGIDINADGIAVVEVTGDGNLKQHKYEGSQRLKFARKEKRHNDIVQIVKNVVAAAVKAQKLIVVERLSFKKKKGTKKQNRARHNFPHHQMIQAVQSEAAKRGIPVIEINPAFTSILGNLKYKNMYSLNRHTAAALVIGRRGMGIRERQDFTVMPMESKKSRLNLEGRGFDIALTPKAYSFFQDCFLKKNKAVLTGPQLALGINYQKPSTDCSVGVTPTSESSPITGQTRGELENSSLVNEKTPCELSILQVR